MHQYRLLLLDLVHDTHVAVLHLLDVAGVVLLHLFDVGQIVLEIALLLLLCLGALDVVGLALGGLLGLRRPRSMTLIATLAIGNFDARDGEKSSSVLLELVCGLMCELVRIVDLRRHEHVTSWRGVLHVLAGASLLSRVLLAKHGRNQWQLAILLGFVLPLGTAWNPSTK